MEYLECTYRKIISCLSNFDLVWSLFLFVLLYLKALTLPQPSMAKGLKEPNPFPEPAATPHRGFWEVSQWAPPWLPTEALSPVPGW